MVIGIYVSIVYLSKAEDLSREADVGTHSVNQFVRLVQISQEGVGHLQGWVNVQGRGDTQLEIRVDLGLFGFHLSIIVISGDCEMQKIP